MKYHLARGEAPLGTFNDLDVSAGLREGRFLPTDLCWTEGMAEWQSLAAHLQLEDTAAETSEPGAIAALQAEIRRDQVQNDALASLGERLGAKMIDWLLLLAPLMVLLMALMDAAFEEKIRALQNDSEAVLQALQSQIQQAVEAGNGTVLGMFGVFCVLLAVNVVLLSVRGQSIGKMMIGIQIVRFQDGSKAGFIKAVLLRWFLFSLLEKIAFIGPALMIGNVLMIFRQDRRCMHDMVADTRVIRRRG